MKAEYGSDATKAMTKALDVLLSGDAKKATIFISEALVVSVCRRFPREMRDDFVLKIGLPNYREREFIVQCKKSGEPFPVKKVQLRHWPTRAPSK